ncbi:MAG TPA: OB-fold nucleic acid binding domain-containing protein [Candidatus Nanoarchaeia archaeon]|nr:OB-fold nucleic acid binding domain-containing protein [Candidatus Nanoarchaeia archaeon]
MEIQQRNTAYKVWIANLLKGSYVKGLGEFESGYVEVKNNRVSRVNLVGSVIDRFEGNNFLSLSLDDGSGVIALRSWNEDVNIFSGVEIGDLILVIGKLKEYSGRAYITPEIVKKLDNPLWLKVRKLELLKEYGEIERVEATQMNTVSSIQDEEPVMHVVEEKMSSSSSNSREVVLSLIENLDGGTGADIDIVLDKSGLGEDGRKLILELIKEGEVFELQVGKLRVMG